MLGTADTADGLPMVSLSKGFVHEIHDRKTSKEITKMVPVGTPMQVPVTARPMDE